MKITLVMNNFTYDITHLVDTNNLSRSVEMKHTIDGQFNTASIYLPQVTKDELGTNIDLSRGIIRNSLVNIEHDGKVFQWRIMADTVTNKLNNTYSHDIALLDRRSELTGITLPDISLTQKSFVSNEKVRAVATIHDDGGVNDARIDRKCLGIIIGAVNYNAVDGYMVYGNSKTILQLLKQKIAANLYTSAVNGINNKHTMVFNKIVTANDPSLIEINGSNIILKKKDYKYNINLSTTALREIFADTVKFRGYEISNLIKLRSNPVLIIKALVDSTTIHSREYTIAGEEANIAFNFDYTPSVDNVTITLTAEVKSIPYQTRIQKLDSSYNKWGYGSQSFFYHLISNTIYNFPLYSLDSSIYTYTHTPNILGDIYEHNFREIPGTSNTCINNAITLSGTESRSTTLYRQWFYTGGANIIYYYKSFTPKPAQSSDPLAATSLAELPTYISLADYSIFVETTNIIETETTKSLAWWVDHALSSIYIGETPLYTIEESTRARLSQIGAPEFTAKNYTLYQLINEVAEYLGGVDWEITADNKIKFIFFDELPIQDISEDSDVQALDGTSDLNGYQSSVQINAENITLRSIIEEGWSSPRSADVGNMQLIDDDLMIPTNYPINFISKVEMKGIDYEITDYDAETPLNITPRIVEYEEWKTLPSQFSSSPNVRPEYSRRYFTKSNTLYYKRGEQGIYGLGYCGGVKPGFWKTSVGNRALFETGAVQIFTENGYNTSYNTAVTDTGLAMTNAYSLLISYYPFAASKAVIYKDDLSGFQLERNAFMNEDSQVNDPNLLGSVAKSRVNRLGGTEYTKSGYVSSLNDLPQLGSANESGQRLTQLITQINDANIKYFATYVNDYNKISTFVGKKSDYRLYEVPNKNIVTSTRIKRFRFAIGNTTYALLNINTPFNKQYDPIFTNFTYTKGDSPERFYYKAPNLVRAVTYNVRTDNYIPVISGNIGTTAFWKLQAKDNYSVGTIVNSYTIADTPVRVQQDVNYGNKYGEFNRISSLQFITGTVKFPDTYPKYGSVATDTTWVHDLNVPYQKDSRETLSIEYQFSFHSVSPSDIMVFNGITKFNAFLTGRDDYEIIAVPCYYRPNKEDIYVDLSKCDSEENTDYIQVTDFRTEYGISKRIRSYAKFSKKVGRGESAMVYYDSRTLELIMWVKNVSDTVANAYDTTDAYVKLLPPAPATAKVTFRTMGYDKEIPEQNVLVGKTKISDLLGYLTPYTSSRKGYRFDGLYYDMEFTNLVDNTMIDSDTELFMKWTQTDLSTIVWKETDSAMYDEEYTPIYTDKFTVNTQDYMSELPSPLSIEDEGRIARVRPIIRTLDETIGFTLEEYKDEGWLFTYAPSMYFLATS